MADRPSSGRPAPVGEATVIRQRAGGAGLRPGSILGHTYRIEALLGGGGLGDVYRARHVELGTEHAIKLIPPPLAGDPKLVQLLVEEARQLARVRHDAIVGYEGLFRDDQGLRYLVMEFVDGPSLATMLAGRRLEPDEVLLLRRRLAEGLATVHGHGIIHRDICPENVILPGGEVARAKLIGFGFATAAGVRDPTVIGINLAARYAFAAPEQLGLFGGRVDSRSDIYSLGLLLAAAAIGFGRTLDMGATPAAATAARQKPPDLSALPATLRPAIAPLLTPRPEDRPASLRALLDGASPTGNGGRPTARRPALWIAGGLAVAAILVAGAVFVALLRSGATPAPSLDDLRARLAATTAGYSCASLHYRLSPDRATHLSGHVASNQDLARLRRDVATINGIGPVSLDVKLMPRPHCEVAALLAPLSGSSGRDAPRLGFASPADAAYVGQPLSLDVRAPGFDSYIYIDYFDSGSGQVLHLFPNARDPFNLRPWRNHFTLFKAPAWTVCGNVGRQLVTLVAAPKPLFASSRPDVEGADPYVAAIGKALSGVASGKGAAVLLFFDLRAPPPWVNPKQACG